MRLRLSKLVGFLLVGCFMLPVLLVLGTGMLSGWDDHVQDNRDVVLPRSPVAVKEFHLESIEITYGRAGMIRPFRRFSLGFEVAGRVAELGRRDDKPQGKWLDEGDPVVPGQLLARLDDRVFSARVDEALARLREAKSQQEQASSDLARADRLRQRGGSVMTDDAHQQYVTQLAVAEAQVSVAEAQLKTAQKSLEDTRLKAPELEAEDGRFERQPSEKDSPRRLVLAKRLINVAESVNPHQTVMELLRVDWVLLVVGVPEADVGDIRVGQSAHVGLLARDRFQRKRPEFQGRVYRVAEAADDTTSLFEVEILLPNPTGALRPGLIALARIVVDRVDGYRIPLTAAVFRDGKMHLFTEDERNRAAAFEVARWIEQDGDLILDDLPPEHRRVVVRGQHRLVDGRPIRRVEVAGDGEDRIETEVPVPTAGRPKT